MKKVETIVKVVPNPELEKEIRASLKEKRPERDIKELIKDEDTEELHGIADNQDSREDSE